MSVQKVYFQISTVKVLAYGSWLAAFVCSLPQYFLFQTVEVNPNFIQCSDVWQIRRHIKKENEYFPEESFVLTETFENIYNIVHLVGLRLGSTSLITILITVLGFLGTIDCTHCDIRCDCHQTNEILA